MKKVQNIFTGLALFAATLVVALPASAASSDSLYVYDFRNSTGVVSNTATANLGVDLTLVGAWTSDGSGTTFTGNTVDTQSTSFAKPALGSTLNVSTTQAVGAAVIFKEYGGCAVDSENITQIGKFAANAAQVKLQLSKCANGKMYPECRIAGALTPGTTVALRGSLVLAAGNPYRLECVKSPDAGSNTQVIMKTTDLLTNQTTVNSFTIAATGALKTTLYLSAGNKYPPATQASNTDQFTGKITKLAYCASATLANAQACLASEATL